MGFNCAPKFPRNGKCKPKFYNLGQKSSDSLRFRKEGGDNGATMRYDVIDTNNDKMARKISRRFRRLVQAGRASEQCY